MKPRTPMAGTAPTTATPATPAAAPLGATEHPSPLLARLEKHGKLISYGLGAVAVGVLAIWLMGVSGRRKAQVASDALDNARGALESGNLPAASAAFQRVIQSFGGTDAAYQAELGINTVRIASGQAQLAVDELKKFTDRGPPAYFAAGAWMLSGSALENLKKFDEAAQAYQKAAGIAEEDYRQVEASLGAARAYHLAGKEKESLDVLRAVVSKYSKDVPGVPEAHVRLAEQTRGSM